MILLLDEAIKRTGGDPYQFFQACYYWKFKKHVDVYVDVFNYRHGGAVPAYVKEYLANEYK